MGKFNRNRLKSGVKKTIEYSNRTKDFKGNAYKSPIDWDALEEAGYTKYSPNSKKTNYISVISYIPGDNDPRQGNIKESKRESTYFVDFWTHKIESSGDVYICPQNTYGEPCPMCEYIRSKRGKMTKEEYMPLRPIRRAFYPVFDELDPDSFVKTWYTPYNTIEAKIQAIVKDDRTGEIVYFSDPDEGKAISFKFDDKGNYNWDFDGFAFKERQYEITDETLEFVQDNPLDKFLIKPDYNEFAKAFDPYSSTNIEEQLDKDEDEEDEEEEKPKRLKPKKQRGNVCHVDEGTFGKDFNEFEECTDCDLFEKCAEEYEKLEEEEEEEKPKQSKMEKEPVVEDDEEEDEDEEEEEEEEEEKPRRQKPPLRRRNK
jgi:hypothetical protein